jgi:pimeloyl-ACP methyl ester carboxylesterase
MAHIQDQKFADLGFRRSTSSKGTVSYHKDLSKANNAVPILVLLHGYPNSAFLWRHVVSLIPSYPLFIPDLPGYGNSAPPAKHDKVSVGLLILDALCELIQSPDTIPQPIILIAHDRGARIAHHLHISSPHSPILGFTISGLALLDIVPTLSQWSIGDSAPSAKGWFHWSYLANPSIAIPMIRAYGGGRWARDMIARWAGSTAFGHAWKAEDEALEVYSSFFEKESVIQATTMDYEAGAGADVEFEKRAIEEGRRIEVPLLLLYSGTFLPTRAKKPILEVWSQPWSAGPHLITERPVGGGVGHFISEEAPEETSNAIGEWLRTF